MRNEYSLMEIQKEMCYDKRYNVVYCRDYDTDLCTKTCDYAIQKNSELEKKLDKQFLEFICFVKDVLDDNE